MTATASPNGSGQTLDQPSSMGDPLRLFPRALTKLYSLYVSFAYPFALLGRKLSVHPTCNWRRSLAHRIKIGNFVQIRKDAIIDVVARPDQEGDPIVVIDDESCIGPRCQISARNRVHIERDVLIGQSVLIMDHGYANEDRATSICDQGKEGGSVRVGEGSWIGYRAAIVCTHGEVVLGRNCVVAANAVVTRSFPPNSVIFGNPARAIKQFDPVKKAWVLKTA